MMMSDPNEIEDASEHEITDVGPADVPQMEAFDVEVATITLRHEPAFLIQAGRKSLEVRPFRYPGAPDKTVSIMIHAAKTGPPDMVYPEVIPGHITHFMVVHGIVVLTRENFDQYRPQHLVRKWSYPKRDELYGWRIVLVKRLPNFIEAQGKQSIFYTTHHVVQPKRVDG